MTPLILPIPFQVPGCCPQQVKALSAYWQATKLWVLLLAWLIPAGPLFGCHLGTKHSAGLFHARSVIVPYAVDKLTVVL